MEIKEFFSPNFSKKKRLAKSIKTIVIHYTGMQSERESLIRLCDFKSKVSCHYLINEKGKILRLVNDNYIAWHAGKSCWKKYKNINDTSIGIELQNKGHNFGYQNYTSKQISALLTLCIFLMKKYNISKEDIVGHSDIAPKRKLDPGEKFPWKFLAKNRVGIWHNLNPNLLKKFRRKKLKIKTDKIKFIQYLNKIGYCAEYKGRESEFTSVIKAFQRHFRKELINGLLDSECLKIALNLAKKS